MPFNLLLLPLLGGYIFVSNCNYTKFHLLRYDSNRLLIPATILSGTLLLMLAAASVAVLTIVFPESIVWWKRTSESTGLYFPYLGTALLAFAYGCILWLPANTLYREQRAIERAIQHHRDPLEMLLYDAFINDSLLSLTLRNGKVYIGWLATLQAPGTAQRISILPLMSGYRQSENKTVVITTYYSSAYQRLLATPDAAQPARSIDNFIIVLPVAELLTANKFDPTLFAMSRSQYV